MNELIRSTAICAAVLLGGCANPGAVAESATRLLRVAADRSREKPYSAESNLRLTENEHTRRLVLDEDQQEEALAALRSLADGREPAQRLRPAEHGVRWSDVPLAVRYAGGHVEMAIVRQRGRITDDEMLFILTTIDNRPAELIVTRTHDERIYQARAAVGRFGDDNERAERLLIALDEKLRVLGRKRGFE